ncbi:MAG: hypothetical protein HYX68_15570 [Planctomycetes bacterium]|nr:hypothetical protein [Planctomycetota bacterium]
MSLLRRWLGVAKKRAPIVRSGRRHAVLELEILEDRTLLAWNPIGPAPLLGATAGIANSNPEAVTGRVTALAVGQNNVGNPAMFLGSAAGGVWRSTDFTTANPTWTPLTDFVGVGATGADRQTGLGAGSLNVGAITVDPNDLKTIYVGTGEGLYTKADGGYGSGLLRSTDGGNTFTLISSGPAIASDGGLPAFYHRAFNKIIVDPLNSNILFAAVTYADTSSAINNPWNTTPATYNTADGRGIFKGVRDPMTDTFTWTKVTGPGIDPGTMQPNQIGPDIRVTDLEYTYSSWGNAFYLFAGVWAKAPGLNNDGSGLWRSIDLGATWQHIGDPPPGMMDTSNVPKGNIGKVKLAAGHADGSLNIYMTVANNTDGQWRDVYKSTNDGNSWTNIGHVGNVFTSGQAFLAFGVSSTSGRVYVGAVISSGSNVGVAEYDPAAAGGAGLWRSIVPTAAGATVPHTDFSAFTFYQPAGAAAGTDQVYAGNDGGFWRYSPNFAAAAMGTWTDLNDSSAPAIRSRLQTFQVDSVAVNPANGNQILEAAWDNAFGKTTDPAVPGWQAVAGGRTAEGETIRPGGDGVGVFYDSNPNVATAYFASQNGSVKRVDNFGTPTETWRQLALPAGAAASPFMTVFAVDPLRTESNFVVQATQTQIYQSSDRGNNWTLLPEAVPESTIKSVVFGLRKFGADTRTNGYYVTLANGKVYWYNQANTPKWQLLGQQFGAGKNISRLVADVGHPWDPANRNDSGYAYLTLDNFGGPQIWQTRDGGLTWQQITGNTYDPGNANPALRYVVQANGLPNVPVQTVVVDQRAGRITLYAGTDTGVYQGVNMGTTAAPDWRWLRFDDAGANDTRLPFVQAYDLQLRGDQLVVGTYGRSVWRDTAPAPRAAAGGLQVAPDTYLASLNQPFYQPPSGILQNDTTDSSGTLAIVSVNGQTSAVGTIVSTSFGGQVTVYADGSFDYTPPTDFLGYDSITVSVSDGVSTADETVTWSVEAPVNSAPVNSVPGSQSTNEDTNLVFSSGNSNLISISDVDAGSSAVQVSLSAMYGTLTLSQTTGLTFSMGDGTADGFMTFTGTIANINAALDGLTYSPNVNYHGGDTLYISTNDQGNTGSGGSQFDFDSVSITVNSVNDAPAGSDHTVYTMQNSNYFFNAYDFGFSDSADGNNFLAVKITSLPTIGTLWLYDGSNYVAVTTNQFVSVSDINSGKLKYTPPANTTGSPTFTFKVQDDGGNSNGGIDLDLYDRTMTISIS